MQSGMHACACLADYTCIRGLAGWLQCALHHSPMSWCRLGWFRKSFVLWAHLAANTAASYRKRTRVPVRGGAPRGSLDDSSSLMGRPRSKRCQYSRPFRLRRALHLVLRPVGCCV